MPTLYSKEQVRQWLENLRDGKLELNEDNMGLADAALILLGMDLPAAKLQPGQLTPHFTLAELCVTSTGLPNTPTASETESLLRTANALEKIRSILGDKPMTVTSAFRSAAVNAAVGGVNNSAHRLGLAADFVCPSYGTPLQIARILNGHITNLDLDQLIYENKGGAQWVHIGLSEGVPRYQALTITDAGTSVGIA